MQNSSYQKALDLLYKASSDDGFLASGFFSGVLELYPASGNLCSTLFYEFGLVSRSYGEFSDFLLFLLEFL